MSKKKKFMCALGNCKKQCFTCSEDEKCDKHWGGKRVGSGRKKANYQTKTIAFRVRVEFVELIKKMVKDYVSERLKGDA